VSPSSAEERLSMSWPFGLVMLCLAPGLLWLTGADFSTEIVNLTPDLVRDLSGSQLGEAADLALRGSYTHTLLEWSALAAAVFLCVLAFVQYNLTREATLPIVGVALVCAGAMDGFHTLAADPLIDAVASNRDLIPFTRAICRTFHATILMLGMALAPTQRNRQQTSTGITLIAGSCRGFLVVAYALISYCANSAALPQTMFCFPSEKVGQRVA